MDIVMTVTIHLKAILMVGTAVHLTRGPIGIIFVQYVNVLSLIQQQPPLQTPQPSQLQYLLQQLVYIPFKVN